MRGKVTVTGANKLFFVFVICYLVFQVILSIFAALFGTDVIDNNIYRILLINEYIIILIPVLLYAVIVNVDFRQVFRIRRLKILPALLIVLLAIPVYFTASALNNIIVFLLQYIGSVPAQQVPVPGNIPQLIKGLFVIAFTPAICEEMLHRGIMLKAYEKRGSLKAVIITALFFGIFHFDITNLLGPIFIGILIGIYVIRTNSIFAGILAHFLNNTIAEVFLFLSGKVQMTNRIEKITVQDIGTVVLYGMLGIIIISFLLKVFVTHTEDTASIIPPIISIKNDAISILTHWPVIGVLIIFLLVTALSIFTIAIGV